MNDAILAMIERRKPASQADWDRVLREVLQETALAGLWRAGFYNKAAFYGGTALRLFYRLDRFSEDLDFTLLEPGQVWKLSGHLSSLRAELEAFGFSVQIEPKHNGAIESAFIKANTKMNLITIQAPTAATGLMAPNRLIKLKLEMDTNPPFGIKTENKTLFEPFPFSVRVVVPSCLFAGKMHACLCRAWKSRVKGRDWYDYLFFISQDIPVDLAHLESRMRQSGHWSEKRSLEVGDVQRLLLERIQAVDWKQAREDTLPFVRDMRSLDLWGTQLFIESLRRIKWELSNAL
ncbi:nucleotidyl transferase AbiEii/AbiGii toxin family protein [bacterium]|nr:nucleotidyl transferase AbiEii/AbiGii toxin family protein [bacterium]